MMKLPKLTPTLTLFIAFISFFVIFSYYFFGFAQVTQKKPGTTTQIRSYTERVLPRKPSNTSDDIDVVSEEVIIQGTIKKGEEISSRQYCPNGLFLLSSNNKSDPILLRNNVDTFSLYDGPLRSGVNVLVKGTKIFELCKAGTCECEDYILIDSIIENN